MMKAGSGVLDRNFGDESSGLLCFLAFFFLFLNNKRK